MNLIIEHIPINVDSNVIYSSIDDWVKSNLNLSSKEFKIIEEIYPNNPHEKYVIIELNSFLANISDDELLLVDQYILTLKKYGPRIRKIPKDSYSLDMITKNGKLFENLKKQLAENLDADFFIERDFFEIKRHSLNSNNWLQELDVFLGNFEQTYFDSFQLKKTPNQKEEEWQFILDYLETINRNQIKWTHEKFPEKCIRLKGSKESIQELRKNIDFKLKERSKSEEILTETQILTNDQAKILVIENFEQNCLKQFGKNFQVEISDKSILLKGISKHFQTVKYNLKSLIDSIKSKEFELDSNICNFIIERSAYLDKVLSENGFKCVVQVQDKIKSKISIKSTNYASLDECFDFIQVYFYSFTYNLDENSNKLIQNKMFNRFLTEAIQNLNETEIENKHSILVGPDKITCVGDNLVVNILENKLKDFFESNTIYTEKYSDLSYSDLKYLQLVMGDQIKSIIQESESNLGIKNSFDLILKESFDDSFFNLEQASISITTNSFFHKKFKTLFKKLIDSKVSQNYQLKIREMSDLFNEKKILNQLGDLEKSTKCVILSPLQQRSSFKTNQTHKDQFVYFDNKTKLTCSNESLTSFCKAEVVVVYSNINFEPITDSSKFIIDKAGYLVQDELNILLCENEFQILPGQAYLTSSGDYMNCSNILHTVVETKGNLSLVDVLSCSLLSVLAECEFRKFKKIAFTIYNSKTQHISYDLITTNLIQIVLNFLKENSGIFEEIYFLDMNSQKIHDLILKENQNFPLSLKNLTLTTKTSENKGTIIQVIYGSLIDDKLACDVIVNSTNRELKLDTGAISTGVLNKAGQSIQNEVSKNYPQGIQNSQVAVSSSGNMKNLKYIFHIALSAWDQNAKNNLKNLINTILKEAESRNVNSIAFPSLGTGILNYPKTEIPKLMFEFVNDYFQKKNSNSCIQKVYFVIFEKDTEVAKAFKDYQNGQTINQNYYSKINSKEYSKALSNLNFKVYIGDITNSNNDIVFNPTDSSLDLSGNVSQALLKKDPSLSLNLNFFKNNFRGIAICKAGGSLKCKSIANVDIQSKQIYKCVLETLNEINKQGFKSITLPLIGTGKFQKNPIDCIDQMLKSIQDFNDSTNAKLNLKRIEICIYFNQKNLLDHFKGCFENTEKYLPNYNDQSFLLISDQKSNIQSAIKELEKLAESEMKSQDFENHYLNELKQKEKNSLEDICRTNNTKLIWDKNECGKITLIGRHKNVSTCFCLIFQLITNFVKEKEANLAAQLMAQKVEWQYFEGNKWISFNMFLNSELEKMYNKKTDTNYEIQILDEKNCYRIADVKNMILYDILNPNVKTQIQRKNVEQSSIKFSFPSNWDPSKGDNLISLKSTDNEFQTVLNELLNRGLKNIMKKVVSIQRVQNTHLYIQYLNFKKETERKYPKNQQIEKTLFHGTNEDCIESIWNNGFNRSYAGKNATAFGIGVYFARDSSYSHRYTDIGQRKLRGHMFISKVIVGKTALGNTTMKVPPGDADTTVNNITDPEIFVIYKDAQAYPEYLVTYE